VQDASNKPNFFVVGVGASAGGLDALRTFFSRTSAAPGLAYVVVVHLSPEHESHLVELLQPYTQMPVSQVSQTAALEPNHVYVIPPNANLNSIDTHLRLSELEVRRVERAPIDHFLRTLAETHGETAVGVVLSGTGSDGALGLRQIKGNGGLTIAQDPDEAEYGSMPQSAIAIGTVDLVLPVGDIAEEIAAYCAMSTEASFPDQESDALLLERILGEVRLSTGQDIAMYSRAALLQHVRRRMRLRHIGRVANYFEYMRKDADEGRALHNDLLLNITEFFRDAGQYETLERALDEILQRKLSLDKRVRVWSVGCSTGEEAYSLAILLIEQASRRGVELKPQVFASELSPDALRRAREGTYPQGIAAWISPERLERFFVQEGGRYHVRRELRDVVTFASHNLFRDPPYAHLDLIVCRNLLPNLNAEMRSSVMHLFYYALEPQGLLLTGCGDGIEVPELFSHDSAEPDLRRRLNGPKTPLRLPPDLRSFESYVREERRASRVRAPAGDSAAIFRAEVERYAPPSVLLGPDNQVVHFSASAARYVRIPGGELNLDVLNLVPDAIGYQLQSGLQAMRGGASHWQSRPLALVVGDRLRRVVVRIDRVAPDRNGAELLLVLFDDTADWPALADGAETVEALQEVERLRSELTRVHRQLAGVQAGTAGVAAGTLAEQQQRDELGNALEQLNGAREEVQAINEELITLHDESQHRIEKLAQLSNDLKHLLESTGLATLLVDTSMNIVRFTPLASELFRIQAADLNRPLADMHHQLRRPDLIAEVRRVIQELITVELEAESEDGRWFLVRAQPYRSALRGLEGAVLVLIDISARKHAELALLEADRHKDEFLAVLAHELRNPLAPIRAGIEVLRGAADDRALVQRVTAAMGRQTEQLVRLVDDLLEVARINTGKLTLRMGRVQVVDVVRDAVAAIRPFIDSLKHDLTIAVPEAPLIVEGDPTRLVQVVGNLLHNAARYTPPGGRIALTAREEDEQALIAVRDNGQGISPQALPHLFEMFYQEHVKGAGLGIGLTLAKKLVELHRGSIGVESAGINMGSTFTVRLPLARSAADVSITDAIGNGAGALHKHRILIVDDNTDAAETLRLLMGLMGDDEVQTACTGAEALEVGASLRPNVVLLDLDMPGMDGYEVARRMRRESWGKDALLVALTGWGQDRHRRRSREAGFDRHMTKPADPASLRAVLNDLDMR
jgi:two-component system, chemotaxis family, CheB/CheR fusion protein